MAELAQGWGHHNLKTAADVRRMLAGLPPPSEVAPDSVAPGEIIDDSASIISPSPPTLAETDQPRPEAARQPQAPAVPKRKGG